jgi:hypothetical protein
MNLNGKLLAGMYDLSHHEAVFLQQRDACEEYVAIFLEGLEPVLAPVSQT